VNTTLHVQTLLHARFTMAILSPCVKLSCKHKWAKENYFMAYILLSPISHSSVRSVVTGHNLTPLKRDDQNVARVCEQNPFPGRTHRRSHRHHHFWQAPLRVRSAERRHQTPEWTVLSQVNCVVHIEVAGFQILLNGFHPCNTRTSQWSPPVSCGGSC